MTAPISFPNIAPPQIVEPPKSSLADLPQLILAITQHRDAVAQAQQQLELERQRTEDQLANSTENRAASKQERAIKQQEFDTKHKALQAHDIVANELPGVLTQPGDFTANAEAARVRLIQQNKQLAPFINDAFNSQLADVAKTRTAIAERRKAEAEAPVAEQTAAPKIAAAKTAAAQANVSLADSKVEAALHKLQLSSFGDQQQRQGAQLFDTLLSQGLSAGQISDLTHTPLPPSIPRDYTRVPKSTNTAQNKIAEDMATSMAVANETIKANKTQALGAAGFLSTMPADGVISGLLQYGANSFSSADQQTLASNYLLYAQGLSHLANSAKASDQDFSRIMRVVVTQGGDKPVVAGQKAILRDLIPTLFTATAHGVKQSDALRSVIDAARKRGVSASLLTPFISLQSQLISAETTPNDTTSRNQQLLNDISR